MNRDELIHQIYTCASCGYCRFGCPVYQETGLETLSVRGRMRIFKKIIEGELEYDDAIIDSIYMCAQCENCRVKCPTGVDFVKISTALKEDLVRRGAMPESQKPIWSNLTTEGNPFGLPKDERGTWTPKSYATPKPSENLYFVSCTASYPLNRIAKSVVKVLEAIGFEFTLLGGLEYCCGGPLMRMGDRERAQEMIMKNVQLFEDLGVKTIFASCAGCYRTLLRVYPEHFRVLHVTQLFKELIDSGELEFDKPLEKKIVYFDGCDLGRHSGVYEEPREVLRAIPGVELLEFEYNREDATCCGGPFVASYPDLAKKIAQHKVQEAKDLSADMLVTACGTCFLTFREGIKGEEIDIQIRDLPMMLPPLVKKKAKTGGGDSG